MNNTEKEGRWRCVHKHTYSETIDRKHTHAQMHTHKHKQILFVIKKEVNSDTAQRG